MATNHITQKAYAGKDNCLTGVFTNKSNNTSYPNLVPKNIAGSASATGPFSGGISLKTPYQQIILNGNEPINFSSDNVYYLKLQIPKDPVYDLNFALLLVPNFSENGQDLDQLTYQFIRYIYVPKEEKAQLGSSQVVLYEYPAVHGNGQLYTGENVQVKIAKPYPDLRPTAPASGDENFLWYKSDRDGNNTYYEWRKVNDVWKFKKAGGWAINKDGKDIIDLDIEKNTEEGFYPIGVNDIVLTHSWVNYQSSIDDTYEFIFKPREDTRFKYLYLYLLPSAVDNDITWLENNTSFSSSSQYYGRHIDLNKYVGDNALIAECYKVNNLLDGIHPERIGIWGRSELMFTINGEEIRIGPSGYYELQGTNSLDINYLGVAATSYLDQFTIDLQY